MILIGKFAISGFFNIVYLITSELFPTSFRGTVFGITNFVARIGGVISPLVNEFMRSSFMIVLGIAGCVSGFLSMFLRETKGKVLMDSLEADNVKGE